MIDEDEFEKTPPVSAGKRKLTAKRSRIGKKPADMPRRPLSGYNFFFSEQRTRIMEEQSRVKDEKRDIFTTLGRIVAERWKKLGDKDKEKFNELAAKDLIRYRKEMDKYNEKIAMRNRKESERLNETNESHEKDSKPSKSGDGALSSPATPAPGYPASFPPGGTSALGEQPGATALAGLTQFPRGATLYAPTTGPMPGTILPPQPGYTTFIAPASHPLVTTVGIPQVPPHQQQLDLGRLAFAHHQNLASPAMLGRAAGAELQLPPTLDQLTRANALYPQLAATYPTAQPHQLDTSSLFSSRVSEATLLTNMNANPPGSHLQTLAAPSAGVDTSLLGQLQQQQQQYRDNESIRQAYARMLQQQQADEESRRFLLQHGWPPGGPGGAPPGADGRYPY